MNQFVLLIIKFPENGDGNSLWLQLECGVAFSMPVFQQASAGGSVEVVGSGRLTLREQQVLQLRREMLHPGGVRLQLRRKDCTGSIALVDAFGAVWYVETCSVSHILKKCKCICFTNMPFCPVIFLCSVSMHTQ